MATNEILRLNPVSSIAELELEPMRQLLGDWTRARDDRDGVPSWRDVGPERLATRLANTMLVDVIDGGKDYLYRYYGADIAMHFGHDMTGRRSSDLPQPAAATFIPIYQRVLGERRPYFSRTEAAPSVKVAYWDRLMCPLSSDGSEVDGLVCLNYPRAWRLAPERYLQVAHGLDQLSEGVCLFDRNLELVLWNEPFLAMMGLEPEQIHMNMRLADLVAGMHAGAGDGEPRLSTFLSDGAELRGAGGRPIRVESRAVPTGGFIALYTDLGEERARAHLVDREVALRTADMAGAIGELRREVAARRRAERALHEEKERLEVTLHSIGDAVVSADRTGAVTFLNPEAERLLGWARADAVGMPIDEVYVIVDEHTRARIDDHVARAIRDDRVVTLDTESVLIGRSGREIPVEHTVAPIRGQAGVATGVVIAIRDATETRQSARRMAHAARHDSLTGLANRAVFEGDLFKAIEAAAARSGEFVLCFIDLDRFKAVNDGAGHAAGDDVLRQVAALLAGRTRRGDLLARLGGDEFGLLMRGCDETDGLRIAEEFSRLVAHTEFEYDGHRFRIGASIGLVALDADSGTLGEALRRADAACYAAKQDRNNRIHIYRAGAAKPLATRRQEDTLRVLGAGLDDGRLMMHCQPIASLAPAGDAPRQVEMLARLTLADGALVAAADFMPAAGGGGLALAVDRAVIRRSIEWLGRGTGAAAGMERIWINLTGGAIEQPDVAHLVESLLAATGVAGTRIGFEVSEALAVAKVGKLGHFMGVLGKHGCAFAIDDFGRDLGAASVLRDVPASVVKLDAALIERARTDPADREVATALVTLAHRLGRATVAEGIGTRDAYETAVAIGAGFGQGNYIEPPRPAWDPDRVTGAPARA